MCECTHVIQCLQRSEDGVGRLWDWSYGQLLAAIWVLGIEGGSLEE